jgi:hypothetical protein
VTRARRGARLVVLGVTVLVPSVLLAGGADGQEAIGSDRAIVILEVPGVSLDRLLEMPAVRGLASEGGAGLLAGGYETLPPELDRRVVRISGLQPDAVEEALADAIAGASVAELLVVVVGSEPSAEAVAARDETLPIVVACCDAEDLLAATHGGGPGDLASLDTVTSDSTRRDGVMVSADVGATVADFLSLDLATGGEPIRIVEGPPPFELHDRYLAHRRMTIPVGGAAAIYLAVTGLSGLAVLALGRRVPAGVRRAIGWACLSVAMLATALLAAGQLPELTYATVVPFVALVTALGTLAFAPLERRGVTVVPAGIGIAVLSFFAVEALLGWDAALAPFAGGSQLDGGRFYGLPNVFIGLLIGSSLWAAHRCRTGRGFWLIAGVALFAGLPLLGSNLGAGVSLFAAAGLWLAVRERERLGIGKALVVFAGVTVAGMAVILLAHAVSPVVTHVTRFEQEAGGLTGVLEKVGDRLQVGFDLIARNPLALIPVLGLPIAIAAVLRPPAPLRPSLEASPAWRDAILVTLLAGVVAYVANDSGPAAAGFAFGLGLGGLLGVSLLAGAGKMGEP